MAYIDLIDDSEIFERDRAAFGYVPNFTRLFAHRPAVYEAWIELKDAISGTAAAARCFFSKTLDALCAQADPVLGELERELRDVLTVGRPIAES